MNSENPKSRPEIDMEGLRSRIKSALSAQRMTVQNLSDAAGIPKSTLDGFLNRGTTPAFDTVATVCAVLSIPSVWFIWDISHPDAGLILYDRKSVIGPLGCG